MSFRTPKINPKRSTRQLAIDLQHVSVSRGDRVILQNVSWQVPTGACAAILGPNGSGKSTLVRVVMGQIWPTRGDVAVLGNVFGQTDLNALRESIRLVQTHNALDFDSDETTLGVVMTGFFGTIGLFKPTNDQMRRRAQKLIRQVGLNKEVDQLFRTLSSGERMRCLIARALVVKPKLLILDEPTAGLDLLAREQVLATVNRLISNSKSPPTLLLITHHVEELLPQTSHVLLLNDGAVFAAGPPSKVLTSKNISQVYQCPVVVKRRDGRFWWQVKSAAWDLV